MLKVLALLFVSLSATRALVNDFTVGLTTLTIALDESVPTSQAIKFAYSYLGPSTGENAMVSMEYAIYEGGCDTIYADDTNTQAAALYKTLITQNGVADTIDVDVAIDLAKIEGAAAVTAGIWTQSTGTSATLDFCGRLEIYFGDNSLNNAKIFVNYHETDVQAQITLTEDGGMHVDAVIWDLVAREETQETVNPVEVEYPVAVYKCDASGVLDATADTLVEQGQEINLCVAYQGATPSVFVESIDAFSYWSDLKADGSLDTSATVAWEAGIAKNLVIEVDCAQIAGVCRINFLVDASYFVESTDANMKLQVTGLAVIAVSYLPNHSDSPHCCTSFGCVELGE